MSTRIEVIGVRFPDTTTLTTNPLPSGTAMIFRQAAAPTGWTRVTIGVNDMCLRVVAGAPSDRTSGSGFSSIFSSTRTPAGSVGFTGSSTSTSTTGTVVSSVSGLGVSGTTGGTADSGSISNIPTSVSENNMFFGGTTGTSSPGGSTNNINFNGTTDSVSGIPPLTHSHDGVIVGGNISSMNIHVGENPVTQISCVTGLNSGSVSGSGGSNIHSHTFSVNHSHGVTTNLHSHSIGSSASHSHGFSGSASYTGISHTHSFTTSVTDTGHSHGFSGASHSHTISAGGSFTGSAMNFNVNYIDMIIATRN